MKWWGVYNGITLAEKWHTGIAIRNELAFHKVYGTRNSTVDDFYNWFRKVTEDK